MKKAAIYLVLILSLNAFVASAQQFSIPQPSTQQIITQNFGLGQITLTYSRPNVKGRKVFGYMEPYGLVWRTGANSATTIKLSDSVTIEGKMVPAGEYALFSIPGEKQWVFILNKTAKQWGAYNYKESDDLMRFTVPVEKIAEPIETFTLQFADASLNNCTLQMDWDNTRACLHFKTDVDAQVMQNIDNAMAKSDKKPYYFASIYYYNNNKDMKKALGWITEADKNQPNSFNIKYWKARIELKAGDKKTAIATATEGVKIATDENNAEYIRLNKEVIAEAEKG